MPTVQPRRRRVVMTITTALLNNGRAVVLGSLVLIVVLAWGYMLFIASSMHVDAMEPAEYLEGATRHIETIGSQLQDLGHTFHDFNVEQSTRSRGVTVWAALKEIGEEGIRARVTRHNGSARRLAAQVQASPVLELLDPSPFRSAVSAMYHLNWAGAMARLGCSMIQTVGFSRDSIVSIITFHRAPRSTVH